MSVRLIHRIVAVAAAAVTVAGGAGVAGAAGRSRPAGVGRGAGSSGVVSLRTTDDHGACAAAPAARVVAGVRCPTFPLYYAIPRAPIQGLVVVFHGHGHNGELYSAQLAAIAAQDHLLAVAVGTDELAPNQPNFRGPFDGVDEEGRDAAAAIGWARSRFHTTKTYVLGVSMGGSGLAYFLDAASRPSAGDVDATWVQSFHPLPLAGLIDAEGISSLPETWAEATGFDAVSAKEIEKETGGTPATAPAAYRSRSLALLPTVAWQGSGLPLVAVIHDVDDGLVPYNQTFEARAAVLAAGLALKSYDVVFKDACSQGSQTTLSSSLAKTVPMFPVDQSEAALCLAGHANENDPGTPIMQAAVTALAGLASGDHTSGEVVFNASRPTAASARR